MPTGWVATARMGDIRHADVDDGRAGGCPTCLASGVLLRGIPGHGAGRIDNATQRLIEFLVAIPTVPLWSGLAAATPPTVPPARAYILIAVILPLVGWIGSGRAVSGHFFAKRGRVVATATRPDGAREGPLIARHTRPSIASLVIAASPFAVPAMIRSKTALCFQSIGARPPVARSEPPLQEARTIGRLAAARWFLPRGLEVIVAVLPLDFLGDRLILADGLGPLQEVLGLRAAHRPFERVLGQAGEQRRSAKPGQVLGAHRGSAFGAPRAGNTRA